MKNKSIGNLILLAVLAPACGGGGGGSTKHPITAPRWSEQYRVPTSSDLRAVRFGDPSHGIAAGKNGTFVRTNDGGVTWQTLEYTPVSLLGDVLAMAVGDITTIAVGGAPAVVGSPPTGNAIAWGTSDATTFVTPDPEPTSFAEPWVDLAMTVSSTNPQSAGTLRLRPSGFADAYQSGLILSINSRHNDQSAGPVADTPWTSACGISAFGSSGVFAICGDNGGVGQIRHTMNNGQFFDTQTLPASCPVLRRMSLLDATHGFAVGDTDTIISTSDMTTWTAIPKPAGIAVPGTLRSLFFANTTLGWAVGDGGRIYKFTFASSTWTSTIQVSNTGQDLYDVSFADSNNGYAVGNNGTVVKTVNGGATWSVISGPASNPTITFRGVDFTASASVGLVVGDAAPGPGPATLLRSKDTGVTWASFNTGIPAGTNLTAVSIPQLGSNSVAFVGTDAGAVYFNTDIAGSGAWIVATGSLGTAVKAMLFPKDDATGFVSGAGGACSKVTFTAAVVSPPTAASAAVNAAATLPGAPTGTLYALACKSTGSPVYVAGDAGYVALTPDSGTTWNAGVTLPGGHSIRALQTPTGANFTLFAGTDDNTVYRLSAGASPAWAATSLAGVGTPASMAFINDSEGWVVTQGTSEGIVYTLNSGGTWFLSVPHVPLDATAAHTLNALWMSPGGALGVIVGGNGVILRTTTGGQ